MSDLIDRQSAIDAIMGEPPEAHYPSWYAEKVERLPSAEKRTEERTETHECDLISRQDAVDTLDEQIKHCNKALASFDISMRDEYAVKVERASLIAYRETIKHLPPAEPEPQWIPCSERLPKVDESVLATTVWNDVTIAWRIGVDKWFIHEGGSNATTEDLIAWMPMPKPYRKDGEAE